MNNPTKSKKNKLVYDLIYEHRIKELVDKYIPITYKKIKSKKANNSEKNWKNYNITNYYQKINLIASKIYFSYYFKNNTIIKNVDEEKIIIEKKNNIIRHLDICKLFPNDYVNDNLINFYLYLFKTKSLIKILKEFTDNKNFNFENIYIFNTFYFNFDKFIGIQTNSILELYNNYNEGFLTKRYYKIFNHNLGFSFNNLFFPIIKNNHWTILYIENLQLVYNKFKKNNKKYDLNIKINMYYFDSLHNIEDKYFIEYLKLYIIHLIIWDLKLTPTENLLNNIFNLINFNQIKVPKQENYYDCGLCIIEIIENFLLFNKKFKKLIKDSNNLKRWFEKIFYKIKRVFYLNLCVKLSEKNGKITEILEDFKELYNLKKNN